MRLLCVLAVCWFCSVVYALPQDCRQAIVGAAEGWNSSHVQVSLLEKDEHGVWHMVRGPFPARLGKNGLAWGRGVSLPPDGCDDKSFPPLKREGDLRSPAGIFELGGVYGTVDTPKKHKSQMYRRIGTRDLWVEDPESPYYNRHVVLDHEPRTDWERRQQMKLNDYAHSLKLFVLHNAKTARNEPVAGAGSSIFFHIWRRDGAAPSAGCTTMSEGNLRALIAWLNPHAKPVYILLPKREYMRLRDTWGLP